MREPVAQIGQQARRQAIEGRPVQLSQQLLPQDPSQRLDHPHLLPGVPGAGELSELRGRRGALMSRAARGCKQALQLGVRADGSNDLSAQRRTLVRQALQRNLTDSLHRALEDQRRRPAPGELLGSGKQLVEGQLRDGPSSRWMARGREGAHAR